LTTTDAVEKPTLAPATKTTTTTTTMTKKQKKKKQKFSSILSSMMTTQSKLSTKERIEKERDSLKKVLGGGNFLKVDRI
jgi:predicted ATP-dependent serine protease